MVDSLKDITTIGEAIITGKTTIAEPTQEATSLSGIHMLS